MENIPEKNQIFDIKIEDMSKEGEGIGHVDGYTLFIKDTVIGDFARVSVMKAKKNYGFARLIKIIEPSPDRVQAPCPIADKCGGCQLMAMSYERQLAFKQGLVENTLRRVGGFENLRVEPILASDEALRYRNKAQYPVQMKNGEMIAGFYARHSHNIIPNEDCLLGSALASKILAGTIKCMQKYGISAYDEESGQGILRHILIRNTGKGDEAVICLVINDDHVPREKEIGVELLNLQGVTGVCINVNRTRGNVITGEKLRCIAGNAYIEDNIGERKYRISPLSFYQVNPGQTKKLYDTVKEFADLQGNERIWDIYCGIGTISLYLANEAWDIIGVEIVPQAVSDAKKNAQKNGVKNAKYFTGPAEEVIPEIVSKLSDLRENIAILDPPRKGCDRRLLDALLKLAPEKIIYVSCDVATLARDLKILGAGGYSIDRVRPVDMFPMTVHVETVVLLSHKSCG